MPATEIQLISTYNGHVGGGIDYIKLRDHDNKFFCDSCSKNHSDFLNILNSY